MLRCVQYDIYPGYISVLRTVATPPPGASGRARKTSLEVRSVFNRRSRPQRSN
jgi:hypothetical protein